MENTILNNNNNNRQVIFNFLENYVARFPNKNLLFAKKNDNWIPLTCNEVYEQSLQLCNAFINLGIKFGDNTAEGKDKIGIISNNRPEWVITDFATQQCGAVLVPIYPTINVLELEFILEHAQVKILFVSDKNLYAKAMSIKDKLPLLQHIFTFDEVDGATNYDTLLKPVCKQELAEIEKIKAQVQKEHLATIIYTSGTTGSPKGVMLSHKNLCSNVINAMPCFHFCEANSRVLSFLPLNHIFERILLYIYLDKGVSIYYAEAMEKIVDNLKEVKPHVFSTVPRLLEKVYEKLESNKTSLTGLKKKIYNWAFDLAEKFELGNKQNFITKIKMSIADKLIYSKWRAALGGEVRAIITGSAACQVRLMRIFTAGKIIIMEGYGLTETSPVVTVNRHEESGRKFGSVGLNINNQEVKIAEDGEILCKGDHIMMGYFKNIEATDEVLKNDWFYTGDIGVMDADGFLKITDRKKELFKLSAGKYVAPLPIESKVKESNYIEQMMVVGSNEKFVGALIVPAFSAVKEYLKTKNIAVENNVELIKHPDVLKLIRQELNAMNVFFNEHEHVKKFELLEKEWTVDSGELTPTLKIKRRVIVQNQKAKIEGLYK
jgi:long-chain acyl-CoA synthetase